MNNEQDQLRIGAFGELVGLSVAQLRRYDRLELLEPQGRSASGYRHYSSGQTGAGRAISLLRSMDMPIADIRRLLAGVEGTERKALFEKHRSRLEARLDETRRLLEAVDEHTKGDTMAFTESQTELSAWLHVIPRIPVTDLDVSIAYYEEVLGFRLAWRTSDDSIAAIASGEVEMFLLAKWWGEEPPVAQSAYVYVEDPDGLCGDYERAGATIIDAVAPRPNGMRDFTVADPDGHRFTLGCGEERLRDAAAYYGLEPTEMVVGPAWLDTGR